MKKDAIEYSLYLLEIKDRTEKQLRERLIKKGYEEKEIYNAVEKMKHYGYINDVDYAKRYVKSDKGFAPLRLKTELIKKGISRDIAENTTENMIFDAKEVITKEINRKFIKKDFSDRKEQNRVIGYFLRRGFSYGDIRDVLVSFCKMEDDNFDC